MGRHKDAVEIALLKNELTKRFATKVEGKFGSHPKKIEEILGIGDKTGNLWCKYRRGTKQMAPKTLQQRIKYAIKCQLIFVEDGTELNEDVDKLLQKIDAGKISNKSKTINSSIQSGISESPMAYQLKELLESATQLATRIAELADYHQNINILTALSPLQNIISSLSNTEQKKLLSHDDWIEKNIFIEAVEKWGETVPEKIIKKLFSENHGFEIVDGAASSRAFAKAVSLVRRAALDAGK